MPRRAKRGRSSLAQPLTFSPFARSFAAIANANLSKEEIYKPIAPAGAAGDEDGNLIWVAYSSSCMCYLSLESLLLF